MQAFLEDTSQSIVERTSEDNDTISEEDRQATRQMFEWFMTSFAGILKEERRKGASSSLFRGGWSHYDRRGGAEAVKAKTAGVLSSSGDYVNGSAVTKKRSSAQQVADLKVAIAGCGAFAKCLVSFKSFTPSSIENILAQMLACVCIFQKPPRVSAVTATPQQPPPGFGESSNATNVGDELGSPVDGVQGPPSNNSAESDHPSSSLASAS